MNAMKTLILLLIFALSSIVAQGNPEGPGKVQSNESSSQDKPKNVSDTEKILDERIQSINKSFENHAKILVMRLRILPERTVAFKGKRKGDDCEYSPKQEDPGNDCLRVDYYDFIGPEEGRKVEGGKYKSIILFFDGSNAETDPYKAPPRKMAGIKSKMQTHNILRLDKKTMEIFDNDPVSQPSHDDKITVVYQIDGYPLANVEEIGGEKGIGRYKISNMENTQANPIRNEFKQQAYIKHLLNFERLLSKIFNFNDVRNNKNYKDQKDFLNSTLNY